jgi:hypothetical protein
MSKVTPELEAEASAAGRAAADRRENCVPAHCEKYRGMIAGFRVGDGAAHLAQRWIEGHRSRWQELVAAQRA